MSDLEKRLAEVKAKYGKNLVQSSSQKIDCTVIPTDIYEFDKASEIGGFPLGKIIEIAGPPSSGKTTLAWQLASSVQNKTNKRILFFDYEQAASKKWLSKLGVPLDFVDFISPADAEDNLLSIEDGFEIMNTLLSSKDYCCVIWDSIAASNPKGLLNSVEEKGLEGRDVALTALALTKGLAVYGPNYRKSDATVIFVNHVRANLNLDNPFMAKFADKERTSGGYALKHHLDIRIDLDPLDFIKKTAINEEGKKIQVKIGQNIKIKFVKNRIGEPYGEEILVLRKGIGFDIISSIIKRAVASGIVIKKSTGLTYLADDETIKSLSYEGFWNLVQANPSLLEKLKAKIYGKDINIGKIDLSAGTRELNIKELMGDETIEEDSNTEPPKSSESKFSEDTLDSLLENKEISANSDISQTIVTANKSNVNAVDPVSEKKKRGRPPKSKE